MKTILFISPVGEFYGGGERSGFEFCKFLEKHDYKVITAVPETSKVYVRELKKYNMDYRLLECKDFENQVVGQGNSAFSTVVSQLVDIIKNDAVSMVITNLYAQSGPIAAALAGVPNISMDRGQAYVGTYFSDFMSKYSDSVIVNSMGLADVYHEKYQINTPVAYSYTAKPDVGLDKEEKEQRLVCVSRISPEKNILQVLKAVNILRKRNIFAGKVLIIGPVPGETEKQYKKELEMYVQSNDLSDSVVWLGDQKNPWSLVGKRDIYLNTSDKESVGRSSIEAIKLGLPAILVDIPGHKDIFEKIGAVKYKLGDTDDLADKIEYMIKNYPEAKRFAEIARQKAEDVISEGNCYKEALPVIDGLGDKTRVRPEDIALYLLDLADKQHRELVKKESAELSYIQEIKAKDNEIASYLGIKRSARIFIGNIKRKIIKTID